MVVLLVEKEEKIDWEDTNNFETWEIKDAVELHFKFGGEIRGDM